MVNPESWQSLDGDFDLDLWYWYFGDEKAAYNLKNTGHIFI